MTLYLSDFEIQPHFGHSEDYYTDENIAAEAFANFFDAGMSYKSNKLLYIMEIFPNAYELFENMLWDDIQNMNSVEKNMNTAGKNMLGILISSHYIIV